MIKLYDYYRSSACFRVRIALNLKNLDHEKITINLNNEGEQFSDFYQKINPEKLVPAMQNGKHIISQSLAILEYLNEVYPDPPLLPQDVYERALVRSFALSIATDIHPLNNLRILKYLTGELKITDEQKNKWYQHWIQRGLSALEERLIAQNSSGDFCFGDRPTLADICLVPQMYNAKRFSCDLSLYKTLNRINENCEQHEAFNQARPLP
jgi:maleylacetoacetate isomerase